MWQFREVLRFSHRINGQVDASYKGERRDPNESADALGHGALQTLYAQTSYLLCRYARV